MPMTQQDMLTHYEKEWKAQSDAAEGDEGLRYSDPVEDAVLYPAYEQLVRDFNIKADGGRVLDVGSGSGRWIRYFLARFQPGLLMGIDFSHASVALLEKWHRSERSRLVFRHADITSPDLDLDETFDLVNVANVLFHIPEPDLFAQASAWMDYSGPAPPGEKIGLSEGITYFDHPTNPGSPAHWHVREDGWMGASVCMHGPVVTRRDKPLVLRYLLHVHQGPANPRQAAEIATDFARSPGFEVVRAKVKHTQYTIRRVDGQ